LIRKIRGDLCQSEAVLTWSITKREVDRFRNCGEVFSCHGVFSFLMREGKQLLPVRISGAKA